MPDWPSAVAQAIDDAASARERIEVLQPLTVAVPSTGLPGGKTVLRDRCGQRRLRRSAGDRDLSFTITGPERIAVTGPNGSGKTTLLALVTGRLPPWTGTVRLMTDVAMLDQQVGLLDPSASIRDFRRLNPRADENACRASLARFMFRADAALQRVGSLSGGHAARGPGLRPRCAAAAPDPRRADQQSRPRLDRGGRGRTARL